MQVRSKDDAWLTAREMIQKLKPKFTAVTLGKHSCDFDWYVQKLLEEDKSTVTDRTEISTLNNTHTRLFKTIHNCTGTPPAIHSPVFCSLYRISKSPAHTSGWDLTIFYRYNSPHPKRCQAPREWKEKHVKLFWTPISERHQWAYKWKGKSGKLEKLLHDGVKLSRWWLRNTCKEHGVTVWYHNAHI